MSSFGTNTPEPDFDLLDANTKEWIDARASWLVDQFGQEQIRKSVVVLPFAGFFPDATSGTAEGARAILDRLCDYMGIEPRRVELGLCADDEGDDESGNFRGGVDRSGDGFIVWIEASQLDHPLDLTATLAFGLGQIHLLGYRRLSEDAEDRLPLTELLTVFLGLGVITANSALHDVNWESGGWQGLRIRKLRHLTMQMYGYALALFASVRDETKPTWRKELRPDVRGAFDYSLKFFAKHGLPDLYRVRHTSVLPSLESATSPTAADTPLPRIDNADQITACSFCAEPLPPQCMSDGICEACQSSIEDNQLELEAERELAALRSTRNTTLTKWGCLIFVVIVITVAVLQMMGLRLP